MAVAGLAVLAFAYPSSSAAPGAIGWANRPAAIPAVSAPVNPGLAACPTASLSTKMVRRGLVNYGTYAYIYSAKNIGTRACYVSGFPNVDIAGQKLTHGANVLNVSAGTLARGASATFAIIQATRAHCTAQLRHGVTASKARTPQLRFGTPAGPAVRGGTVLTSNCVTAHATPIGLPMMTQPKPDSLSGLRVALTVPSRIAAGRELKFAVTITNPTTKAVKLSPCPSYEMGLSAAPAKAYKLNCSAVTVIRAGQSRTFDMRFSIPAGAQAGRAKIGWFLLNPNRTGAGGAITITG